MMALLTDLPAELLRKILEHFIQLHQANLDELKRPWNRCFFYPGKLDIRLRASSNLRSKETYHSNFQLLNETGLSQAVSRTTALPPSLLLPLCLVNRALGKYVQQALFAHVTLIDQWQAHLFYQALTSPSTLQDQLELPDDSPDTHGKRSRTQDIQARSTPSDQHPPTSLACQVRSLQFKFVGPCSLGRGGGSLVCQILRACPLVENITIATGFMTCCQEPLLDALASRPFIKTFVLLESFGKNTSFLPWTAEQLLGRLFTKWESLQTIELIKCHVNHRPLWEPGGYDSFLPALNCALRTIVLNCPCLKEKDLAMILNGSRASLRNLQICHPTPALHRPGLYRILTECISPALESLTLEVNDRWGKMIFPQADYPDLNPGLLDHVFKTSSTLSNLKELSFAGDLTGEDFLDLLPQSIVKLTWNRCGISFEAFSEALTSGTVNSLELPLPLQLDPPSGAETRRPRWLPELKCCSIYNFDKCEEECARVIRQELDERRVCFHSVAPFYRVEYER
ncbi:hypothetical protein PTTG_06799 [Puccinia triticina 1-1 BBBD Race 1]|uniref:Uncharacterized protein n=2 Tax=Puccinia triticina TaxID=208348 RepID=A0A180GFR8_PUCT1|nr:hypothetical protein PTTG_06799 [Puccinia triticina 1-1 BBBD Race 1]